MNKVASSQFTDKRPDIFTFYTYIFKISKVKN